MMLKYRLLSITILLLLLQVLSYGETNIGKSMVDYSINWKNQELEINIRTSLQDINKPLPSIKTSIEREIDQKLAYILLGGIQLLTIDSKTKGEDYIKIHPSILASIFELTPKMVKNYSIISSDLKLLITKYSLKIYPDVVSLFILHSRTSILTPGLDFTPSANFTGIVIYVDAELPMYGKQGTGLFVPSLFPEVYDEALNPVIGPLMVNPEIIKKYGTVGYQTLSDSLDLARIGQTPLTLKARGIFGINNTDLIISSREAAKILSRQNNLDLIKKGKILIIYNNIK